MKENFVCLKRQEEEFYRFIVNPRLIFTQAVYFVFFSGNFCQFLWYKIEKKIFNSRVREIIYFLRLQQHQMSKILRISWRWWKNGRGKCKSYRQIFLGKSHIFLVFLDTFFYKFTYTSTQYYVTYYIRIVKVNFTSSVHFLNT